jgi:hypothetical protein
MDHSRSRGALFCAVRSPLYKGYTDRSLVGARAPPESGVIELPCALCIKAGRSLDRRPKKTTSTKDKESDMNAPNERFQGPSCRIDEAPARAQASGEHPTDIIERMWRTPARLPVGVLGLVQADLTEPEAGGNTQEETPSAKTQAAESHDINLVSLDDHLNRAVTSVPYIIDGVLVEGERCIVFGEAGTQKSWLLLDMAISIATGEDWLGHFKIPAARQVLYVDEEQSERLLTKRLKQLANGRTMPPSPSAPLQTLSHRGMRFTKDGAAGLVAKLAQAGFDPDVIIVESLARVLDGNENEGEDVSAFWRHLEPLRKAGKTVIISHHMRKPNPMGSNAPRDRLRGSTDLLAGTDSAFSVEATRQDGKVRSVTVACAKFREAEAPASFEAELVDLDSVAAAVAWQFKGQVQAGSTGTASRGSAQPKTRKQQAEAMILTELLKAGTSLRTAALKTKARGFKISESMVEEALRSLETRGDIAVPSRGKRRLTASGQSAAQCLVPQPPETADPGSQGRAAANVAVGESTGDSADATEAEAA